MIRRQTIILTFLSFLGIAASCPAQQDDDLHHFFTQLRSRYLFELAEGECNRQIEEYKPESSEYAEYTLELSRTYTEHAKYVSDDEQKELWNQSRSVVQDLWKKIPKHPYRWELEKEAVRSYCEEAHYVRWLSQIRYYDNPFRKRTLKSIEATLEKTRSLEQRLNQFRQSKNRNTQAAGSSVRLRQLLNDIRYLYARTILDHLILQKSDSPNRRTYLKQGLMLVESISKNSPHDELKWKTQVLQIDFDTQAMFFEELEKIFAQSSFEKTASQKPDAFLVARVRYLHARNEYTKASLMLAEYVLGKENISGELYFVYIVNQTNLWKRALQNRDSKASSHYIQRIRQLAARCQQNLGGFWGFRCRALLRTAESIRKYGPNLAPVVLKAGSLFSSKHLLDAATEYKSAFRIASRENKNDSAAKFLYLSASLYVQTHQYEAARSTFQEFLLKFPHHRNRSQAHLLYAFCLGQIYAKETTQSNLIRYAETLEEHRREFKNDDTFVEATWMLAQLEEQRQQIYSKALNLYREIPLTHPRYAESQVAVTRCYESILNRLRKTKQPAEEWETYVIDQLGQYLHDFPNDATLSAHQAEVLVRLSRILLNKAQPDYRTAERYLKRVFDSWQLQRQKLKGQENSQTKQSLRQWTMLMNVATQFRIVSLAGNNQIGQAQQLMDRISKIDASNALAILDGLTNLNTGGTADFRYKMGRLQLVAAENLQTRRSELSTTQVQKLDRCLAQAYTAMNKPQQAIAIYEKIYKANPNDDRLLRSLAELLFACKTADCQRRALVYWQKIGSKEKQGADAWLDARYRMALCQFNLKNYRQCRKILAVIRLLYPNSGQKDLRDKIQNLLDSAKKFEHR